MQKLLIILLLDLGILPLLAQSDTISKTKIAIGLSAPELLHVGINTDLSTWSQVGISQV